MPPQQSDPHKPMTLDEKFNCVVALAQFAAKPAEPFLRVPGTAGSRYFGFHAWIGTLAMTLWIAMYHPFHAEYAFWAVALAMFALHKVAARWTALAGRAFDVHRLSLAVATARHPGGRGQGILRAAAGGVPGASCA